MGNLVLVNLVLLGFLAAAYGWGAGVLRLLDPNEMPRPGFCAALGLAVWIAIGGYLNALGVAYAFALDALVMSGVFLFVLSILQHQTNLVGALRAAFDHLRRDGRTLVAPLLILIVVVEFYVATLMPSAALNFHDDFHKYLVPATQMLQTGSAAGGPFDVIGRDYLGSQAFLQAFILAHFPLAYVNGLDLIFCLLIAGLVVNDIGLRLNVHWVWRTIAIAALAVIHPQYVNISALYSGAMMILAAVYAALVAIDSLDRDPPRPMWRAGVPLGVLAAAAVSLKATLLLFTAIYVAFLGMLILACYANRRRSLVMFAGLIGGGAAALFPWVLLSTNNYLSIFMEHARRLGGPFDLLISQARASQNAEPATAVASWLKTNLDTEDLFYGSSFLDYNIVVVLIAIGGVLALISLGRSRWLNPDAHLTVTIAVAGAACLSYFLLRGLVHLPVGLRYSIPILIGCLPAITVLAARVLAPNGGAATFTPRQALFMAGLGLLLGQFSDSLIDRMAQAREQGAILAFRVGESYVRYNQFAFGPDAATHYRAIQDRVPRGEKLMLWSAQPFQFDFARNDIWVMNSPGLVWERIGRRGGEDAARLAEYLKANDVGYVVWEHSGYGVRSDERLQRHIERNSYQAGMSRSFLKLRNALKLLAQDSKVLMNDQGVIVLALGDT